MFQNINIDEEINNEEDLAQYKEHLEYLRERLKAV